MDLGAEQPLVSEPEDDWRFNYFNYFTEVEEHFQQARGTSLFLLSPLDWALIETWKNAGVPLVAVLRGVDAAFEKWRSRKSKVRAINSLAYCTQEVLAAAQVMPGVAAPQPGRPAAAPFELDELQAGAARAKPVFWRLAGLAIWSFVLPASRGQPPSWPCSRLSTSTAACWSPPPCPA